MAALAVVLAHFFYANGNLDTGAIAPIARFGLLGVEVFFVISGFILPYSLWVSRYRPRSYGRFILRRVVRLDPPYFVTITLAVGLGYLTPLFAEFRGQHFSVAPDQLLFHFAYLNAFFGKKWIVIVFWTLAIEFQFYLTLGIVYPVLESPTAYAFPAFIVLCLLSQWAIFQGAFLPYHWPIFLLGMAVFRYRVGMAKLPETFGYLVLFSTWAAYSTGLAGALAGLSASLCILWFEYGNRVTDILGNVSYSLYLIHQPIGNRIANLGARFCTTPWEAILISSLATLGSLGCAWIMWRWVERPSQRWASRIRLH